MLNSDGDYVYFWDSTAAYYYVSNNCQLTSVGGLLDRKGYGIAIPQGEKQQVRIFNLFHKSYAQDAGVE